MSDERDKVHRRSEEYGAPDAPEFAYGRGDCFTVNGERAWFVHGLYWEYGINRADQFHPAYKYHQKYALGRVQDMGGTDRLVAEAALDREYEAISEAKAEEIDL